MTVFAAQQNLFARGSCADTKPVLCREELLVEVGVADRV